MKKFPITAIGIKDFQTGLYRQDDALLQKEALSVADDFLSWSASRFELELSLLEELRNLPETFRLQLGWCLAAIFLARGPLALGDLRTGCGENLQINVFAFRMDFAASSAVVAGLTDPAGTWKLVCAIIPENISPTDGDLTGTEAGCAAERRPAAFSESKHTCARAWYITGRLKRPDRLLCYTILHTGLFLRAMPLRGKG